MNPRPQGNGSGKFEITQSDMGGWIRIFPAKAEDALREDLALYLSQTLTELFRQKPHLHMKCVAPINRDGNTVELHAWYEVHVIPPTTLGPQPSQH
jgi:hypothetical protein